MKELHQNLFDIAPPFMNYYEPVREFANSKGAKFKIDDHTIPPFQLYISDNSELHRTVHIFTILEDIAVFEKRISGYGLAISAYYDLNGERHLYFKDIKKFKIMPPIERTLKLLDYSWHKLSLIKKEDLRAVYAQKGIPLRDIYM